MRKLNIKIWAGNTAEEGIICMMFSRKNGRYWSQYNNYWFLTGYLDLMPYKYFLNFKLKI